MSSSRISSNDLSLLQKAFSVKSTGSLEENCFEAIWHTCERGQWDLIEKHQKLISRLRNLAGQTLFFFAILTRKEPIVKKLLLFPFITTAKGADSEMALHVASQINSISLNALLMESFHPNDCDAKGNTPLHIAILNGHSDVVSLFLQRPDINRDGQCSWHGLKVTPLCLATLRGEVRCIDLLINATTAEQHIDKIGYLLHITVHFHQPESAKHLLESYRELSRPLLEKKRSDGKTPLSLAIAFGDFNTARVLLENGANVDTVDHNRRSPVHLAVVHCDSSNLQVYQAILDLLFFHGANLDLHDSQSETPLSLASQRGDNVGDILRNRIRYLKSGRTLQKEIDPFTLPPLNLAFKGGGPKGVAYVGAIKALEDRNLLSMVQRVSGTSAGAITASLLATGHQSNELTKIFSELDFSSLLDDDQSMASLVLEGSKLLLSIYQKGCDVLPTEVMRLSSQLLGSMPERTGVYRGEAFRRFISRLIDAKVTSLTGKRTHHFTLGELKKLVNRPTNRGVFKHIHIFGTTYAEPMRVERFSSEDDQYADYILADVVRKSMSIPFVFEPHPTYVKRNGRRMQLGEEKHVDGGLIRNLPVEAFDQKRFLRQDGNRENSEGGYCPQFNMRTIGFDLVSSEALSEKEVGSKKITNLLGLARNVALMYFHAEERTREINPYNGNRIIQINVCDVGLLNFRISPAKKKTLIENGYQAVSYYLKKRNISAPSIRSSSRVQIPPQIDEKRRKFDACCKAAQNGQLTKVKELISEDPSLLTQCSQIFGTLLHYAAMCHDKSVFVWLENKHPPITKVNTPANYTPLHAAASANAVETCEYICGKYPHLRNTATNSGELPIHYAASNGSLDVMNILYQLNPNNLEEKYDGDYTLLHATCESKCIETFRWALRKGGLATLSAKTTNGETIMHTAAAAGFIGALELIHGENPSMIFEKTNEKLTPLDYALDSKTKNWISNKQHISQN